MMIRRRQRLTWAIVAALFIALGFAEGVAGAAPITFEFSGVLTQVSTPGIEPPAMVQFYVGQPFRGRFTYDPDVPDQWPDDPLRGYYPQDISAGATGLEFYVGDDFFITDPMQDFGITIGNDIPEGILLEFSGDYFSYRGGSAVSSLAGDVQTLKLGPISTWRDTSGEVFSSDEIPRSFHASQFDRMEIEASVVRTPFPFLTQIILTGEVQRIEVVPEPSCALLVIVGPLGLVLARRLVR